MAVTIDGAGPITGLTSITAPTTLNGLTIPTTGFGKVLQVVRATDITDRTTTKTSFEDAGISVTITPQRSTSAILIIAVAGTDSTWTVDGENYGRVQITDSSNITLIGGQNMNIGLVNSTGTGTRSVFAPLTMWAYATPGTTSAVTYKLRFRSNTNNTFTIRNDAPTGQMYAIELADVVVSP